MKITYANKVQQTANHSILTLQDSLELIQSDKYLSLIEGIRTAPDKPTRNALKSKLPVFYFAGTFQQGVNIKNETFQTNSGIFLADVDGLSAEELTAASIALREHPAIYFYFKSPSGDGLKIGFKYDPALASNDTEYKKVFKWFEQFIKKAFDLQIDRACKNSARACYLSHDPDLFHNDYAVQLCVNFDDIKPAASTETPKANKAPQNASKSPKTGFKTPLERCINILTNAGAGHRHNARLRAFELLGGYIAGGVLQDSDFNTVFQIAHNISDDGAMDEKEQKACFDAYEHGLNSPIYAKIEAQKAQNLESLPRAQDELKTAISEAFKHHTATVIKAPAGLGKTEAVLKQLDEWLLETTEFQGENLKPKKAHIYVPTHKLSDDLLHRIVKDFPRLKDKVFVKKGRNLENCQRFEEIEWYREQTGQFSVKDTFCASKQGQCPFFEQCQYQQGLIAEQEAQIVIMAHAYLRIGAKTIPDLMVIDESFWKEFASHYTFKTSILFDEKILNVEQFESLVRLLQGFNESGKGAHLWGLIARENGLLDALNQHVETIDAQCRNYTVHPNDDLATIQHKAGVLNLKRKDSYRLAKKLLDKEITFQVYDPAGTEITFFSKKLQNPNNIFNKAKAQNIPIVAIDADADLIISRRLFDWEGSKYGSYDRFTEINVARNLEIKQVLKSFDKRTLLKSKDSEALRKDVVLGVSDFARESFERNGQKTLVVTYKKLIESAEFQALKNNPFIEISHFGAIRGIDRWKGFNVCILGRNQPPDSEIIKTTDALFSAYGAFFYEHKVGSFDRQQVFNDSGCIGSARFFNGCSNRFESVADAYNIVLQQIRESETSQAIARCRDIHQDYAVQVLLMDDTPLVDLNADQFTSWGDFNLNDSERLLKDFFEQNGYLIQSPKVMELLTGVDAEKWKRAFKKLGAKIPYSIYKGKTPSVYEIKIKGNSNRIKLHRRTAEQTDPRTLTSKLSGLLGKEITLIEPPAVEPTPEQPEQLTVPQWRLDPEVELFDFAPTDEDFEGLIEFFTVASRVSGIPVHKLLNPDFFPT